MTTSDTMEYMRSIVEALKKEPKRKLSVTDITRGKLMPWATHHRTIVALIVADMEGPNFLKATKTGEGFQTRYEIEARNLISYIERFGQVLMCTSGKSKQYDNGAVKRGDKDHHA